MGQPCALRQPRRRGHARLCRRGTGGTAVAGPGTQSGYGPLVEPVEAGAQQRRGLAGFRNRVPACRRQRLAGGRVAELPALRPGGIPGGVPRRCHRAPPCPRRPAGERGAAQGHRRQRARPGVSPGARRRRPAGGVRLHQRSQRRTGRLSGRRVAARRPRDSQPGAPRRSGQLPAQPGRGPGRRPRLAVAGAHPHPRRPVALGRYQGHRAAPGRGPGGVGRDRLGHHREQAGGAGAGRIAGAPA
ncbi:hypothetical protein D3C84_550910 [compost metagenome]